MYINSWCTNLSGMMILQPTI